MGILSKAEEGEGDSPGAGAAAGAAAGGREEKGKKRSRREGPESTNFGKGKVGKEGEVTQDPD